MKEGLITLGGPFSPVGGSFKKLKQRAEARERGRR
jgi:hypothetical protein